MQVAEKPTLLILAAGLGRRYGGMKQLEQVGPSGETLLDYAAFDAMRAGFGHLVFVIGRNMREEFEARVGARFAQPEYHSLFPPEWDLMTTKDLRAELSRFWS